MAEIVLALDLPAESAALGLLDRVPAIRWVKIGPILFTAGGPALIERIKTRGLRVFLDLKWHDIPNTVGGAVTQARRLGVDMVTVHSLGGAAMLAAAAEAAGSDLAVVAVTVLTSHTAPDLGAIVDRTIDSMPNEVLRLATLARGAGVDGVVASPLETAALRAAFGPDFLLVTPGIRGPDDSRGDQSRVATAAAAVRDGSTHLIVGRPILEADDPAAAWEQLVEAVR